MSQMSMTVIRVFMDSGIVAVSVLVSSKILRMSWTMISLCVVFESGSLIQ